MHEGKKNVLIFSKTSLEPSTELVMDWISYLGHRAVRINGDSIEDFQNSSTSILENAEGVSINDISFTSFYSVWFRRWSDYVTLDKITDSLAGRDIALSRRLNSYVANDISSIESFLIAQLKPKKFLTSPSQIHRNKLVCLLAAKNHGLSTPSFIVTTDKKVVTEFYNRCNRRIVLKDLDSSFSYGSKSAIYSSYTVLIDDKQLASFPEKFFLTFFQEYIEKEYEVRCFVLGKLTRSMAIFSQKSAQTQIDFRRYNFKNPNRKVPYKLPHPIQKKILKLMKDLDLETGSVDLIKCKNGKYYFLEVNPVGQFGFVSEPCNYNLHFEIAKYLTS